MKRVFVSLKLVLAFAIVSFAFPTDAGAGHPRLTRSDDPVCEGNACSVVTLTWEQERQQYKVQNSSAQPVKVEVTTFAGTSSVNVGPNKSEYLEVKTFNGPFVANYQ